MNPSLPNASLKIAVVVPTLGRPAELRRMLRSLDAQSHLPDQVIIIDESEEGRDVAEGLPRLNIQFHALKRGSTSAKRNLGARFAAPDMTLISFLDDDIVLEPDAMEAMLRFWETASPEVGAASFNLANRTPLTARWLKSRRIARWLGLSSPQPGAVLRSGIQTRIDPLQDTAYVEWLATTAVVFRRDVLRGFAFDDFFEGYGYLEDLEFTYRVAKKYKLAVVANARVWNYPSPVGRDRPYFFGKKEVINRLYFVCKNKELSVVLCLLALFVRMLMSLSLGIWGREFGLIRRAGGNCTGMFSVFFRGLQPVRRDSDP